MNINIYPNKHQKTRMVALLMITSFLSLSILISAQMSTVEGKLTYTDEVTVLLFTNANSTDYEEDASSSAYTALDLDERINIIPYTKLDDKDGLIKNQSTYNFTEIDVVVMENFFPMNDSDEQYVLDKVENLNIGLLFMGGFYHENISVQEFDRFLPAYFTTPLDVIDNTMVDPFTNISGFEDLPDSYYHNQTIEDTETSNFVDDDIQVAISDEEDALDSEDQNPFTSNIAWQSCPLLHERFSTFAKKDNTTTLVEVPNTKEPLMVTSKFKDITNTISSNASVIYLSPGTGYKETDDLKIKVEDFTKSFGEDSFTTSYEHNEELMNEPFSLWPYFNYLMYMSVYYLDHDFNNELIETYAQWEKSPIPHEKEATIWMIFVASLWVFNFALFFTLGKKKGEKDIREMKTEIKREQIREIKRHMVDQRIALDELAKIIKIDRKLLEENLKDNHEKRKMKNFTLEGSDMEGYTLAVSIPEQDEEEIEDEEERITLFDVLMEFMDYIDDEFDDWAQEELLEKQEARDIRTNKRENLEALFNASDFVKVKYIAQIFHYKEEEMRELLEEALQLEDLSNLELKGSFVINKEERETRLLLSLQKLMNIFETGEVPQPKLKEEGSDEDESEKSDEQKDSEAEEEIEAEQKEDESSETTTEDESK